MINIINELYQKFLAYRQPKRHYFAEGYAYAVKVMKNNPEPIAVDLIHRQLVKENNPEFDKGALSYLNEYRALQKGLVNDPS